MNARKTAAYLIYVENQAEYEKFLQYCKSGPFNRHISFTNATNDLKSNYIIVDPVGSWAAWGGNDLRPFGYYATSYYSINGGAMTVDSFMEIDNLLHASKIATKEYVVPINDEIYKMLVNDGYRIFHRPYFAMTGSTHSLYSIRPLSQDATNAAKVDSQNITQEEFINSYWGAKTDVDLFVRENFTLSQTPSEGFGFITDDGQFCSLAEKGYGYVSFIAELEKQNYYVDFDGKHIPDLEEKGYIYCDTNMRNETRYVPFIRIVKLPSPRQFEALKLWIKSLPEKTKLEVSYYNCETKKFWLNYTPIEKIFDFIKKCAEKCSKTKPE